MAKQKLIKLNKEKVLNRNGFNKITTTHDPGWYTK